MKDYNDIPPPQKSERLAVFVVFDILILPRPIFKIWIDTRIDELIYELPPPIVLGEIVVCEYQGDRSFMKLKFIQLPNFS